MLKLFKKDAIWFSVVCILAYVVLFASADRFSESIGYPKLLTVAVGCVMTVLLLFFLLKNRLTDSVGLCAFAGQGKDFLFFIPLIALSSVNLKSCILDGQVTDFDMLKLFAAVSMFFVGLLEEIIFRGLLFNSMCRQSVRVAFLVSSLTFGMGHIVNLLSGAPVFDTLMQILYASAVGFCYTAIFYAGGSIFPCMFSHIFVNVTSVFSASHTLKELVIVTVIQTALGVGYGTWILHKKKMSQNESEVRHV